MLNINASYAVHSHKGSLAEEALGQLVVVVVSCKRNNRRNHKMGHTTSGRHLDMLALKEEIVYS